MAGRMAARAPRDDRDASIASFATGVVSNLVASVIYERYKDGRRTRTVRRDPASPRPSPRTVRRTTGRRYPLLLRAAHPDAGPYYLVDLAGRGVSWREPAVERIDGLPNPYPARYAGASSTRRAMWVPVFRRAALAFHLADEDEGVDAKLAKKIADAAYAKLGAGASATDAVRYAWYLVDKSKALAGTR